MTRTQQQTPTEPRTGCATPDEFFGRLLDEAIVAPAIDAAAVWAINPDGVVQRVADRAPQRASPDAARRVALAIEAMTTGSVRRAELRGPDGRPAPTLMAPVSSRGRPAAAIEAVAAAGADVADAVLARLTPFADAYATRLAEATSPPRPHGPRAEQAEPLHAVALRLHEASGVERASLVAANELRLACGVDRVAVVTTHSRAARIAAVSGSDRVAHRSEVARGLRAIAQGVVDLGAGARWQPGDDDGGPLGAALARHAAETGATFLEAVPLRDPSPRPAADGQPGEPKPLGVLVLENLAESKASPAREAIDSLTPHVAVAVRNAAARERALWPMPAWLRAWLSAPGGVSDAKRAALRAVAAAAVALAFAFIPAPHRVVTRGLAVPTTRSVLFAPSAAEVAEVLVTGGQPVAEGEPLVRLESTQLSSRLLAAETSLGRKRRSLGALRAEAADARDEPARIRLSGRVAQAEAEIAGLEAQLATLRLEQARLVVRAPHAGRVATFDAEGTLRRRPVARGDALLEVMDFDGPWSLRLDCPVDQIGHLTTRLAETDSLPVTFTLSADPGRTRHARTTRVARQASVRPSGERVVRVEAVVEAGEDPASATPVAAGDVVARVDCGWRPLGYVLFGRAYDAARTWWW